LNKYVSQCGTSLQATNKALENTVSEKLGMRITAIGPDFIMGQMPVDERTRQPFGVLHGGASMALAETLGSHASMLMLADEPSPRVMGIEIGGSHLRSVSEGNVTGVCRALKLGRNLHFWRIDIMDEAGQLCCSANLTVMVSASSPAAARD